MKKLLLAIFLTLFIIKPGIAQIDTNIVVYSWKLDESFANRIRVDVDTALENFQQYNPAFKSFTFVQSLGNFSAPARSAVYTERPESQEFVLINNFMPFMKLFPNTRFINSRKPFTRITYIKGGSNQTKEEVLDAFHSQNLTKTLNFGVHYTTIGALGQYKFQRVKNNSFNLFSSLTTRNYAYHFSINYNKIFADENGGVLNDSLITDSTFIRTKDIPTLFGGTESSLRHDPDVLTQIRNINILAVQELSFRSAPRVKDMAADSVKKKLTIFYPKLVYIFNINRTLRLFADSNPMIGLGRGLWSENFVSDNLTSDSLVNWKITNALRLQFQGRRNNHYFIDYSYELMKYSMSIKPDTATPEIFQPIGQPFKLPGLTYATNSFNSFVSSGFSKIFGGRFDVNLYGRYYVSGYQAGDLMLSGDIKLIFGKTDRPVTFYAKGLTQSKTPDFLYTRYASNNFIWTKNFTRTTTNHLSTNLAISSNKFDIQGDYYLLSSAIYLDDNAFPAQYNNALSIIVLSASKRVDLWKITSLNRLVYQKSENENIIDLPAFVFNSSTYFKHLINFRGTGGKLLIMLGFDLFYNTSYYADAYMPSLSSFHRQHVKKLGNYPYFDAFLNMQLKRFKFFVKVEHVNAGWIDQNYFSVLHYPRNGRDLKFGLSWTFYD